MHKDCRSQKLESKRVQFQDLAKQVKWSMVKSDAKGCSAVQCGEVQGNGRFKSLSGVSETHETPETPETLGVRSRFSWSNASGAPARHGATR